MKRRYQIDRQCAVQQFRQLAREQNPSIQMIFPMAEVVGLLQKSLAEEQAAEQTLRKIAGVLMKSANAEAA